MTTAVAPLDPERTALLLMDFQPAIISAVPDHEELLGRARTALAWARERGVKVVFVRVAFTAKDYDAIPHHNKAFAAVAQNRFLADGGPECEIDPSLEVRPEDVCVRKTRFGAFSTTDLHDLLQDQKIDTLVVGGVSTAGVVLSSVRDAADQDYRLFVLSDATADPDPEVHRVLVTRVLPRQAEIIETSDLPRLSGSGTRP